MDSDIFSRREFLKIFGIGLGVYANAKKGFFRNTAPASDIFLNPVYLPSIFSNSTLQFNRNEYILLRLSDSELPYNRATPLPLDYVYPKDKNGVVIFTYQGQHYYHPVQISQLNLLFLESYRLTNNIEYFNRAELHLHKLIEISNFSGNGIYFPYLFDWALHGIQSDMMIAPWYSGMAQGQAGTICLRESL